MKLPHKKSQLHDQPRRRREASRVQNTDAQYQFRRGRTITGSTSSHIASTNELNSSVLSPRAQSHHLTAHRRKLTWRFIAVLLAVLAVYVVLSQLVATVSVPRSAAITSTQASRYAATLDTYLSRHPVERFNPSLNTAAMTAYLQSVHPEISSAQLRLLSSFGKAQLQLTFRTPIARWSINGSNEYVDATGTVFKQTTNSSTKMIEIVDKNGLLAPRGGVVASRRFLSFVGLVVGDMQQRGYQVKKATLPALTTRQLSVSLAGIPYTFKLSTDRSAGEQSEDIDRIITYLKRTGKTPSYVDVRVKGKAFYK